jgi:hypothetical protein
MASSRANVTEPMGGSHLRLVQQDERVAQPAARDDLPDFRADSEEAQRLAQSRWRALLTFPLPPAERVQLHEGFRRIVEGCMDGRDPYTAFSETDMQINFAVENDSPATRATVQAFGNALMSFVNQTAPISPEISIYCVPRRHGAPTGS